jgi:conjugative transfer region lipoprotein (TIGR03751 family)
MRPLRIALLVASINLLGCASNKESLLPHDGPTMQAIYESHMTALGTQDPLAIRAALGSRPVGDNTDGLAGYSSDAFNELDVTFPRLPNPTLVMYVYPHLATEERVPIPGYATTFPLYLHVEYALPGEVPDRR